MGTAAGQESDAGIGAAGTGEGGGGTGDAGASAANADGTRAAAAGAGLDRSKLPPILQNLDETQITEVFDTLFTAARNARPTHTDDDMSGVPAHARPKPAAPSREEMKERFRKMFDPNADEFDPQAAMEAIVSATVAPAMGSINQRAIAGMLSGFRDNPDYPDFRQHEKDILTVLSKRDPASLTEADVVGTYFSVVGLRAVEGKKKAAAAPAQTRAPSPDNAESSLKKAAFDQLSDVERSVAKTMYPHAKDPFQAYLDDAKQLPGQEMKVPVGGGKTA